MKKKPTKRTAKKLPLAERIAERLFDSGLGAGFKVFRLARMSEDYFGGSQKDRGGWCKYSVIRIINEELEKGARR